MMEVFNEYQGLITIIGIVVAAIIGIAQLYKKSKGKEIKNMHDNIFNGPINVGGDFNNNTNGHNNKNYVINSNNLQDNNILEEYKDDLKEIIDKFGNRNKELDMHYSYRIKDNKITLNSKMYSYSICYEKDSDIIYFIDKANFNNSLIIGDLISFINKINNKG